MMSDETRQQIASMMAAYTKDKPLAPDTYYMTDSSGMLVAYDEMSSRDPVENKEQALHYLQAVLTWTKSDKPNDRSDKDRQYAIVITELEKVTVMFRQWVVNRE